MLKMYRLLRLLKNGFVVMMFFCLLVSCGTSKVIVNDLEEKEANEIIVFLAIHGITAEKSTVEAGAGGGGDKVTLYKIGVDSTDTTKAMAILNRHGYPRKKGQNLLSLFSKGGLVPSEMEEKIRHQAGMAEELANTIRKIDGVIDFDRQ